MSSYNNSKVDQNALRCNLSGHLVFKTFLGDMSPDLLSRSMLRMLSVLHTLSVTYSYIFHQETPFKNPRSATGLYNSLMAIYKGSLFLKMYDSHVAM